MFNDSIYVKVNFCIEFFRVWLWLVELYHLQKKATVLDTNDTNFCLKDYQIAQLNRMGRALINKVTNGT